MKIAPGPPASFTLLLTGPEAAAQQGRLFEAGQYWVWGTSRPSTASRHTVLEKLPDGVVEANKPGYFLHAIKAGVSHHITHLFGYWYTSDADGVWLQAERGDQITYAWIIGGRSGVKRAHRFGWLCPACGAWLVEREHTDPEGRADRFLAAQLAAVREFNRDAALRTCHACGRVHPLGYGLVPDDDLPEESAVRERW